MYVCVCVERVSYLANVASERNLAACDTRTA